MIIGVPREIKTLEFRVGLVPDSVGELVRAGHTVLVETHAGDGISVDDDEYQRAGAEIVETPQEIFAAADMIVKVKEPQPGEVRMLKAGQVLFTYLHLAADETLTRLLEKSGAICIAYETITDARGHLPLLQPMSEVAGRMSVQVGAHCLEKEAGGSGILLGGVAGVPAAQVVVLGGGTVGTNAIRMAVGMEAQVTVIDRSIARLRELDDMFGSRIQTVYSTTDTIGRAVAKADLVIGAVLIPGAAAPRQPSDAARHAPRLGAGRRRHRPGRLLRDLAPDHPRQPDLCRGRRRPLLRHQYAGRGAAHLDLRAEQRHPAFRHGAGQQGLAQGAGGKRASAARTERVRRPPDQRRGGRRFRAHGDGAVGAVGGLKPGWHQMAILAI